MMSSYIETENMFRCMPFNETFHYNCLMSFTYIGKYYANAIITNSSLYSIFSITINVIFVFNLIPITMHRYTIISSS